MTSLLYLLPVALALGLLASRRLGPVAAGAAGLAATLAVAPQALPPDARPAPALAAPVLQGAWLAWQAIAVILAGLLFHAVMQRTRPWLFGRDARPAEVPGVDPRRLFAACFLLGPFFEAATGFGIGLVIVIPFLLRNGVTGVAAVVFGLYSQILVPWGAMAIGSTVGAGLAGVTPQALGVASAWLTLPLLAGHLVVFWALQARLLGRPRRRQLLDDLAWTAALGALLVLANASVALEAGALVACGLLLLVRLPRDAGGFGTGRSERKAALRAALPYLALTLAVLATRGIAPLRALLEDALALQPAAGLPAFPPLYHVSVLILAVALVTGASARLSHTAWRAALAETGQKAWAPVLVTLLFVAMGRVFAETGMAAAVMADLSAAAGPFAVLAVPLPAALAGLLTGSNVAANAIMMPLQVGLAEQAGAPVRWVAALQNLAGSTFTLLSPIRVAMGLALVGLAGSDARVYRTAAPIGAVALALLLIEAAVILAL